MNAIVIEGQKTNLITDYVIKVLGLDDCADTIVGDDMIRGISGGEKKRTTIGEMLVGPAQVLLMDEISTGLDSTTAFRICKYMRDMVHAMDLTMVISLLQPTSETFELFDDIILLSEGQIVYQGPCEHVLEFFESVGFKCPERKGVAEFLQEVTSKKDQEQYWSKKDQPYKYISVPEFVQLFQSSQNGRNLASDLRVPFLRENIYPGVLAKEKYGISNRELLKAGFSRRWLLTKRNAFFYVFKSVEITVTALAAMTVFFRATMHHSTIADGEKYLAAIFFSLSNFVFSDMAEMTLTVMGLPVFYKQKDFLFYPAWAYGLPVCILRVPLSAMESALWTVLTYYTIGFAPGVGRFFCQWLAYFCIHQMGLSIFRAIGALGRTIVIAHSFGFILLLAVFVLGGYIIRKGDIHPWMTWAYYLSPMMYGQQALVINEFLDERWSTPNTDLRINEPTVGKAILASRGFFKEQQWFWISIGALVGFSLLFNLLYILALTYLNSPGDTKATVTGDYDANKNKVSSVETLDGTELAVISYSGCTRSSVRLDVRRMVLPFQPISLAFNHINYYVDTPSEMKSLGHEDERLQLLRDVCGAFRPGILTAIVGATGAGKTTLMDVLVGRKTRGYIDGSISVSGYPKNQATFARVSGYCEQNDIHSPHVTVLESLVFSAWLRLSPDVDKSTRKMFIEEVMELIELKPLRNAMVGLPGLNGLSIEQRRRLTIAVELVANPSIVFLDEPTSGLDARAAAIVMRTIRNMVDTGRTVVCTIHQPSIDIFEAFDELLLMKHGGQIIYAGPIGHRSHKVIKFFEAIPGVPKINVGYNPATWMLDISTPKAESQLGVNLAEYYVNSSLYQTKVQDLMNLMGLLFSASGFLGGHVALNVQAVVASERAVYYRERAAGMYSALPFALAQGTIEAIYLAITSFPYTLILFSMIRLEWTIGKFLYFYYFVFMFLLYYAMYGMMLISMTPRHEFSAILMSFFIIFWKLFAGFLLPRPQIPSWCRWYYWASPEAWTLYGLVTSQVGDKNTLLEVPEAGYVPLKFFLKLQLGYDYDFLPLVVVAHLGWVLLFFFVFVCGIKFLNFQKR